MTKQDPRENEGWYLIEIVGAGCKSTFAENERVNLLESQIHLGNDSMTGYYNLFEVGTAPRQHPRVVELKKRSVDFITSNYSGEHDNISRFKVGIDKV